MLDIFISYGSPDRERAEELFDFLKSHGFRPWMDKKNLLPGVKWRQAIERSLNDCDVCVFLVSSKTASRRGFFQREMKIALDRSLELLEEDIYIIPVKIDNCDIPERFSDIQYLELDSQVSWTELLPALSQAAEQRGILSSPNEIGHPFVESYTYVSSEDEDERYKFYAKYPIFKFPSQPELEQAINSVVKGRAYDHMLNFRKEALEGFDKRFSTFPSEQRHDFRVEFFNSEIASLSHFMYYYPNGAAHGNSGATAFNFSTLGGSSFRFFDLLENEEPLVNILKAKILSMKDRPIASIGDIRTCIEENLGSKTWFRPGRIVVHFDPYEIFSYAHGPFDIEFESQGLLESNPEIFNEFGTRILKSL